MSTFVLSTDSCCDCYKKDLDRYDVKYISLAYIHNGEEHRDNCNSDRDYREFYEFIRGGNLPTTTQLNVMEMEEYLEHLVETTEGDIVHITLSSGLSGTYNNAVAAAKELMERNPERKIYIVDSLGATQVQNWLVDRGIADRTKGLSALETYEDLCSCAPRLNVIILPRDLFHLYRGGRVSRASAVVGSMLQIKPLIEFTKSGKLKVTGKVSGWTKGMRSMVKFALKNAENVERDGVYIAHADAYEDSCEIKAMLQEEASADVKIGWIGPIIGTHTGPGTVGLIVLGKERELE